MSSATRTDVPVHSFLHALAEHGSYVDCYALDVPLPVSHAQFVRAFYTTRLFKAERFILRWAANRPSSDEQADALANGTTHAFAVWRVARRSDDELLLTDETGRTSSWLKVVALSSGTNAPAATRLYFGSAIQPQVRADGERRMSWIFHALLGAHELYSRRLLEAAAARLVRT